MSTPLSPAASPVASARRLRPLIAFDEPLWTPYLEIGREIRAALEHGYRTQDYGLCICAYEAATKRLRALNVDALGADMRAWLAQETLACRTSEETLRTNPTAHFIWEQLLGELPRPLRTTPWAPPLA